MCADNLPTNRLDNLLQRFMERSQLGAHRLSGQIDSLTQIEAFVHKSNIKNWTNGYAKTVRDPWQLVAVGAILNLNKTELNQLLLAGGLSDIDSIQNSWKQNGGEQHQNWFLPWYNKFNGHRRVRQVQKIICLVKACREDGTPLLLTYKSPDWRINLFINLPLPEVEGAEFKLIKQLLASRLSIAMQSIEVFFNRNNDKYISKSLKETADREKAAKYGPVAQYIFHYAHIRISSPTDLLLREAFQCKDLIYEWRSLASLKSHLDIRRHNSDILEFLSSRYDQTLFFLDKAFEEFISHHPTPEQ